MIITLYLAKPSSLRLFTSSQKSQLELISSLHINYHLVLCNSGISALVTKAAQCSVLTPQLLLWHRAQHVHGVCPLKVSFLQPWGGMAFAKTRSVLSCCNPGIWPLGLLECCVSTLGPGWGCLCCPGRGNWPRDSLACCEPVPWSLGCCCFVLTSQGDGKVTPQCAWGL